MTGRHVLGKEARSSSKSASGETAMEDYPIELPHGGSTDDDLVSPGAVISTDTHVGVEQEQLPSRREVRRSPADPDALIQHGVVGDGHEME
ncbi:MAG TPA: hypothetical protein VN759_06730 [Pseudolysinimonas sp.]|nr:hypothetical protein [Pseudolysinimonas sp.]